MWKLTNSSLGEVKKTSKKGLELFELGNYGKSPLFKSNPLATYNLNQNNASAILPVIDNSTSLVPAYTSKLYKIDYIWTIDLMNKVNYINDLEQDSYCIVDDLTLLITNEETVDLGTTFYTIVPEVKSDYTYSIDFSEYPIDSITKVSCQGLLFDSVGTNPHQFTFLEGILTLHCKPTCRPFPGQVLEVTATQELTLNTLPFNEVLSFNISQDLSSVEYISYQNKNFYSTSSLGSGTLIYNNYTKKVLCLL